MIFSVHNPSCLTMNHQHSSKYPTKKPKLRLKISTNPDDYHNIFHQTLMIN